MSRLGRIYAIADTLSKSQLRAGRAGRGSANLFRNPAILGVIDVVCFVVFALVGYGIMRLVSTLPQSVSATVVTALLESLVFVPALIPGVVLIAGVLFEMSSSSKFASSDSINWLPVTQVEYVTASTLSVAFNYSVVPSVILGLTLWPAVSLGHGATWVDVLILSSVSLFYGGAIVEILRAAVNRMSTVVMQRARRGALVLRLVVMVLVILAFQVIFNFYFLVDLINSFSSSLSLAAFLPILWASLAVKASLAGDVLQTVVYSAATFGFAAAMLWVAVKVRSRYWSPTPSQVTVTHREYVPGAGSGFGLSVLGLGPVEVTLVKKDLKGLIRRRELLQYFAIPFVMGIVFLLQFTFNPALSSGAAAAQTPAFVSQLPVWFVGGFFGLIISSISYGQEQKSASMLYALPLTAKQIMRAKLFVALLLPMVATVGIFAIIAFLTRPPPLIVAEDFAIAVAITVEEVCLGLAFGARYPDFQERPRPRFVDPIGILILVILGLVVMFLTALPVILIDILSSFSGAQSQVQPLFLVALAFAVAVVGLSYSFATRQTKKLFTEFKW